MRKQLTFVTIILVALSSIALIVLQLYWIKSSIKTERTLFRYNVSIAMEKLNTHLERYELKEYFDKNPNQKIIFQQIDSIKAAFSLSLQNHAEGRYQGLENFKKELQKRNSFADSEIFDDLSRGSTTIIHSTEVFGQEETEEVSLQKNVKKYSDQLSRRSDLLNKFVDDMLNYTSFFPIEMRLNVQSLDSLIRQKLHANGVVARTIYGVYKKNTNEFIYINNPSYEEQLTASSLRYTLYPSDLINTKENTLVLFFPDETQLIYNKNIWFIVVSIVFIVVIFVAFAIFVRILFMQKKVSEIKNDFINNMTHEIKTPISTIALVTEILSDTNVKPDDESLKQYLQVIKDENKRLQNLVEQILQRAKLEKSNLEIQHEIINIHDIIEKSSNNAGFMVMRKNGKIIQHLNAKDPVIKGDKMHITNIIYNLLDNANKYTLDKPVIEIYTRNIGNGIEIIIKDNGIGISKGEQDKIFEKFYRIPTGDVHNVKGYGIGLSYVKQVVDLHEGTIHIQSELKKGSKFIIYLPKG